LELAHKALLLGPLLFASRLRVRAQEHIPHKRKQLAADDGVFPLRPGHGLLDSATVVRMRLVASNIGAIHREARNHFLQRVPQAVEGKVPGAAVLLRQAIELIGQHMHFAGE
jgi:hypothetical protein